MSRASWGREWIPSPGTGCLVVVCGLIACSVLGRAAAPAPVSSDEKLLRDNGIPTDGPGLLEYLRKRFTSPVGEEQIRALIEQLGDESFSRREEASRQLVLLGGHVKKYLRDALQHTDLEVRYRAERCLKQIDTDGLAQHLLAASVRVLARRAPAGAAALLVAQLPSVGDDEVSGEVREALVALAVRAGKPEPVLVTALTDRSPLRRAAAAVALARSRAPGQLAALARLLDDRDPEVRVSVALELARLRQKDAIPVLIASLDGPVSPQFGQVEELLFRLAGEKSPSLTGEGEAARQRYRKDWEAWWKQHRDRIDLAKLDEAERSQGRTLVVLLDDNQVLDLDANNNILWKIDNVEMVLDAQPLPGDRVLLAEYRGNRVTERNSKGEILWERKVPQPLVAQRLANGHTLIANSEQILEVDRTGRQVFTWTPPGGAEIMRASKLPGGDILLVIQLGTRRFVRTNRFGRELKSFGVEVSTSGGRLGPTSRGTVLIPELDNNRICEYDRAGRLVREIPTQRPIAAVAVGNGHVMVTSMTEKRAVELDRSGKEVWEYRRDTRVTRAIRH